MANHNGVYYSSSSGLNLRTAATTRINISTGGVIQFNSAYTFPTSDGSANTVLLTNGSGALSFGTVPNAGLTNSSVTVTAGSGLANGGLVSLGGSVTLNVGAGTGIQVNADSVQLDYVGTNNFIDSATNLEGTAIAGGDTIIYHDATDNNVKKGFVSDLPFSNNSGTVTSVAISGTDGIDVDSGSPITTSGTITLGLSNVPNAALANSSVTIGSTAISLGGTSTTLAGLTSVAATTFTGALSGNASTASKWANARTITLGTDLSGSVSIDGSANVSLNASIVAGAVGSTELATNAVTTVKITDGNVTNAKFANSSFTVNAPSGTDPVIPLGGTFNLTSSDSSVTISGNSTSDTIDLKVAGSVNTYVTGGTFSSGTLQLDLNDGTHASDITGLWTSIPNSALANSSVTVTAGNGLANGGSVSLGGSVTLNVGAAVGGGISVGANDISLDTSSSRNVDHDSVSISAGTGLSGGGTIAASRTISLDYAGTNNFIDSATNLEGTGIAAGDTIVYHDATDNNVKKGFVSDLPFSNNSGTVTSVAISGTDGIDVDSGSPITTSGTITLGLSNVPNSSLANDSITIGGNITALGGTVTGDDIISNVSAGQIANSQLAFDSMTINGVAVPLGGSINVGDITGVSAGTGLTGGGTSGAVTVSLDYAGTNNFIDSATNLEGTGIALGDTIVYHDATDNNVKKGFVSDLPFTNSSGTVTSVAITGTDGIDVDSGSPITTSGTITLGLSNIPNSSLANSSVTVTAGNGLANGGAVSLGSSVTLNVGAGTGIVVNANDVALDYAGTDNFIDSATNLEGTDISGLDTIVYHDATDNNVKKGLVSDLPFTDNIGTVTSVGITAGALIDVTNSPITSNGNITVAVDLSELTTSTSDGDGDYFAVVDTSNVQRKLTKGNINLSGFNDNISLYRANGTLSSARLITQNSNNLLMVSSSAEMFEAYNTNATARAIPRVRFEAADNYSSVMEIESSAPGTFLIDGYAVGGAPVFSVDGQGNLTAISKAFDIPHPNPEKKEQGMRLKHGNLEGPEHGVYVRGRQIDDKEIELPEYWRDLVDPDSITVQLTSVGSHQNLYVKKIEDNVVYIGNGNLFSNKIDCYYYIQAERKDIDKITVEYTR